MPGEPDTDGAGRRTFLKTVGAVGATAAAVSQSAGAGDVDPEVARTVDDELDVTSTVLQVALVVYTDGAVPDRLDGVGPVEGHHDFETLPIAYARLTGEGLREVATWDDVRRVAADREVELYNHDSQEDTNAREVWESADLGYTGENVEVAIIDSGVDGTHPALSDALAANYQYVGNPTTRNVLWADVSPGPSDSLGHGTHCAGSICGNGDAAVTGDYTGMAPGATLYGYNFPGVSGTLSTCVAAYDHIVSNNVYGDTDVRLVSNSWGLPAEFDPWDPVTVAAYRAFEEGIVSVFAAGNSGSDENTMGETQRAPFVLTVAATDADQHVTSFSSRGVSDRNHDRRKGLQNLRRLYEDDLPADEAKDPIELQRPAVAAKGEAVMSSISPSQPLYASAPTYSTEPDYLAEPLYSPMSGTSMACPTTAGCTVLFLDAYVDEHGEYPDPIDTIYTLEATADEEASRGYTTVNAGAGYVDAMAAVERAVAGDLASHGEVDLAPEEPAAR